MAEKKTQKTLTFEQVNAHVERNYPKLSKLPKTVGKDAKIDGAKLKQIYAIARPILVTVGSLFILPKKWKDIINTLVSTLDLLTGQAL